jgi:anti-sigma regulatory factor (Ser/Thr protein kinase)
MTSRAMDSRVFLDREFQGRTETLRQARVEVAGCLAARHLAHGVRERAELIVSELASNAVQAAPGVPYRVRVAIEPDDSVVIALTSESPDAGGLPPRALWGPTSVLAETGRGLLIVDQLSDDVTVDRPRPDRVVVTATLR